MARYDRDPVYLHPILYNGLQRAINAIVEKLPEGHAARLVSGHRTPADQFELFKIGREFRDGKWVKVGKVVTNIDGFTKLSQHNYLPCQAIDIGLFNAQGKYLEDSPLYKHVKRGAAVLGLDWGGDWEKFVDQPHIEIPASQCFQGSRVREAALQWQRYLQAAGAYAGAMDGLFGRRSEDALVKVIGTRVRDMAGWAKLFKKFGPLP